MQIHDLGNNLHELTAASYVENCGVVASPTGRIYAKNYGFGIIWVGIYRLLRFIGIDDLEEQCRQYALKKTQAAYHSHLQSAANAAADYRQELEKRYLGIDLPPTKVLRNRVNLAYWYSATLDFRRHSHKLWLTAIRNDLTLGFEPDPFDCNLQVLSEGLNSENLRSLRHILKVETALRHPLPLKLFSKISRNLILAKKEQKELEKLVSRINKHGKEVGIRSLHKALKHSLTIEPLSIYRAPADLATLEMALVNLDCSLFVSDDQKMLARKRELKSGDLVMVGKNSYILGKRLGNKPLEEDFNVTFTTDDPQIVLSFAANAALPALKQKLAIEESWGVRPVEYLTIDSRQGIIKLERLNSGLKDYVWKSDSEEILAADRILADPICKMINFFLIQKKTPLNLDYLMFDARGLLKSLKISLKGDFDFLALIEIVSKCAAGNRYIFRYLILQSNLAKHPYARYLRQMVDYACKGERHSASNVAGAMDIAYACHVVQRGRELENEVAELHLRCSLKIAEVVGSLEAERLSAQISAQIWSSYNHFSSISTLPPFLEEEVISAVISLSSTL